MTRTLRSKIRALFLFKHLGYSPKKKKQSKAKQGKLSQAKALALAKLKKKTTKVGYRLLKKRRREKEVLLVLKKKQSKAKQGSKETCSYCLKKSKAKHRRLIKQSREGCSRAPLSSIKKKCEAPKHTPSQASAFYSTSSKLELPG